MSMILDLRGATDAEIDALLAQPETIRRFLGYESGAVPDKPAGLLARLFGKKQAEPAPPPPRVDGERLELDVDKAWHGIHYLLTGSGEEGEPPLNFLLCGGAYIGDIDVGYGPARAMRPAEVNVVLAALNGISSDELRKRFNPAEMMEAGIYPTIWDRDPSEDDTLGYLVEYFEKLKSFLAEVAARNLGLVLSLG